MAKSKLIVSALSRYDEEYQAHFTGLRGYKLYAHGTFYAKNIFYNPIKTEILVGPPNFGAGGNKWLNDIRRLGKERNIEFKKIREIYPKDTNSPIWLNTRQLLFSHMPSCPMR
jgi:hypothetical protein